MGPAHGQRLSSAEAASRLGVKPATLYAYVSRGLLRSQRAPDGRTTTFDPAEVDRLARRGRRRGRLDPPGTATPPAVPPERSGVGELVFASALTSIDGGVLRYRGLDASELAGRYSFEQVAGWLWTGRLGEWTRWRAEEAAVAVAAACQAALPAGTLPLDRLRVAAAALAAADELRFELHPEAVVTTGRALVAGLVDALPELPPAAGAAVEVADGGRLHAEAVAARLWRRLSAAPPRPGMVDVLDVALVLAADHELAASAVAARVAASVQADPYAVVGAGLGSVSGALHGGLSLAAETLLAEIGTPERARRVIGDRLRWGEQVPGLGHSLYPDGDPRAACLLGWLGRAAAGSERLAVVAAVVDAVQRRRLPAPNVDFALAGLAFVAGMTRGAAETVFAVGRIAGWLAHALEEYQRRTPIRPRARYTGPPPTPLPDLRQVGPAHRPPVSNSSGTIGDDYPRA